MYFPPGTYVVAVDAVDQLRPGEQVAWRGAGMDSATIRVANAAGSYPSIICGPAGLYDLVDDFSVADLTIDQNTGRNLSSDVVGVPTNVHAVFSGVGGRIAFDRVRSKDVCGINSILVSGAADLASDVGIRGGVGNFVQGAALVPDYDNSFLFFQGEVGVFTGNAFTSEIESRARCVFEVHGPGMVVAGNYADGYQTLANLVTGWVEGNVTDGQVCTGNVIKRCS